MSNNTYIPMFPVKKPPVKKGGFIGTGQAQVPVAGHGGVPGAGQAPTQAVNNIPTMGSMTTTVVPPQPPSNAHSAPTYQPVWSTVRAPQTFGQWVNNPSTTPFLTSTTPGPLPQPVPTPTPTTATAATGGGSGSGYGFMRRGGGGGGNNMPSWLMNLYNWQWKG